MSEGIAPIKMKGSDWAVAAIVAVVTIVPIVWVLMIVLPILVALAANTIVFVGELIALALLGIVFLDKNTWLTILYTWKNISRSMRKAVVRENPIGVLDTVIERFGGKLDEIQKNMITAVAARKRQEATIKDCRKKQEDATALATAATKMHRPDHEIEQQAVKADRWGKAADDMTPMLAMLKDVEVKMQQAQALCTTKLEDMKNEREVLAVKLETMKEGQAAVKSFKRFFGTNPDLAMMQMSVDEIERQSTEAEAEIDEFMRAMTPAIEEADLAKKAETARAMAKFDKFLTGASPDVVVAQGELVGVVETKR